jgi:hypothetical protein
MLLAGDTSGGRQMVVGVTSARSSAPLGTNLVALPSPTRWFGQYGSYIYIGGCSVHGLRKPVLLAAASTIGDLGFPHLHLRVSFQPNIVPHLNGKSIR